MLFENLTFPTFMLLACIITNVLAIALPSLRISPLFLRMQRASSWCTLHPKLEAIAPVYRSYCFQRIATIALSLTAFIVFYNVYIQSIGSGIEIFSDLFIYSLVPIVPLDDKPSSLVPKEKKENLVNNLKPWYVSGFTDAEGSFIIKVIPNKNLKLGYQIQAIFQFTLHSNDKNSLLLITTFFKEIGFVNIKSNENAVEYRVTKIEDLVNIIIPHFDEFPLQSALHLVYRVKWP